MGIASILDGLGSRCVVLSLVIWGTPWLLGPLSAADQPAPSAVLELTNGDFVRGALRQVTADRVLWHGDSFSRPLTFSRDVVKGMKYPPTTHVPRGTFLIELSNRDVLYGDVLSIDQREVRVNADHLGEISIARPAVRRIARNQGGESVLQVPDRLDAWTTSDDEHWRSESGSFVSDRTGASLYADVDLPSKVAIELDLAWQGKPNFAIYLGTKSSKESRQQAYSIEAWGDQIVAQRRSESAADLAMLRNAKAESLHVYVYLDQEAHELIVYGADGLLLAELEVPVPDVDARPGIYLLNRGGNVRLKHMHLRSWSGIRPRADNTAIIRVQTAASVDHADELALDAGVLTLTTGEDSKQVDLKDVQILDLPATVHDHQPLFVAAYQDGCRVSGDLVSATDQELVIASPLSNESWRLSTNSLRGFSLAVSDAGEPEDPPEGHRRGTLELMDTRLTGWLIDDPPDEEGASCLVWRPAIARNASPLRNQVYGRIVYRKSRKPVVKKPSRRPPQQAAGFLRVLGFNRAQSRPNQGGVAPRLSGQSAVHLRSGDAIPCEILSIDQQGVRIDSSLTESSLIPHDQIKAAQLADNTPLPRIPKAKRERLLTLPRMQRHSPPLHLLFSTKGDALRGNVLSLTENELELEVRLDPHKIPRSRVATVVWLHPDEMEDDAGGEQEEPRKVALAKDDMFVQVVSNAGNRFSFVAESFSNHTIYGTSDVLENVHANTGEIDQLLLGQFVHRAARSLPYHRWRLVQATNPRFVDVAEQASQESILGTESNLVGTQAPNVRLKMLQGGKDFRVADHLGKVVVLDFWATWCGPCLQVMPLVEQVVSQFPEDQVKLISVNLEEGPELIRTVLERRGVEVPVALDRDGVAAIKYEATSIPQTVVIGPDGMIQRVFVGVTRDLDQHLHQAITELVDPAAGPSETPAN